VPSSNISESFFSHSLNSLMNHVPVFLTRFSMIDPCFPLECSSSGESHESSSFFSLAEILAYKTYVVPLISSSKIFFASMINKTTSADEPLSVPKSVLLSCFSTIIQYSNSIVPAVSAACIFPSSIKVQGRSMRYVSPVSADIAEKSLSIFS
jgi:hypothetical protein